MLTFFTVFRWLL